MKRFAVKVQGAQVVSPLIVDLEEMGLALGRGLWGFFLLLQRPHAGDTSPKLEIKSSMKTAVLMYRIPILREWSTWAMLRRSAVSRKETDGLFVFQHQTLIGQRTSANSQKIRCKYGTRSYRLDACHQLSPCW